MMELSYRRHRFPPVVIQHAVWLYLRFTLSYRDVEDLLAERGLDISYETVRCRLKRHSRVDGEPFPIYPWVDAVAPRAPCGALRCDRQ
jgi:transposase-like protein